MYRPKLAVASPLTALLLVISIAVPFAPSTSAAAEGRGTPIVGDLGVSQTTRELMELQRRYPGPRQPVLHEEHEFERDHLPLNPASPRVGSIPNLPPDMMTGYRRGKGLGIEILSPQTIGVNFTAATLSGANPTNAFPPDCDGAIGPTQYVVGVNGRVVSFNKTTGLADGVLNLTTDNFFNSVRAGSGTSDPQVRYDRLTGRWFLMIINVASTSNRVLIGVSDAASAGVISPSTVWTFFQFVAAAVPPAISPTCFADYPSLGVDANALYIGTDNFCPSFTSTDGFVVRKSSILGAGPMVVTAFRNLMTGPTFVGPFAPRGVDNVDPNSTEGYFIGVDGAAFGVLDMHRISDPGGTPSISANIPITIPATSNPLSIPHLGNTNPAGGTTGNVDPLDDRVFYAQIRNQQLWVAQNIAVNTSGVATGGTRNGTRWHQFDVQVGGGTPTIVQSGTVFDATATNPRYYNVPSIVVSGQGHAALSLTTGGAAERLNAGTVGRLADDPLGTMQTPVLLTASATAYNPPNDTGASRGRRRWGDYSVMAVDPIDDQTMWSVNMFCNATNTYGVQVTKLIAPGPAFPSTLPDVAAGYPTVNVTLTGLPTGGAGFFDPGPNLPGVPAYNHLQASISNGAATGTPPTVVSATYINPTTVNLVLNSSSATPNIGAEMYTITITNPDGQQSSAAIVHVVAGTQFTIDASAGAGGSITPSGMVSVLSGNDQTFTITPDHCYEIADVLVDGGSVGAVTSYTFPNVTADHTIVASFNLLGPYTITASAGPNGSISDPGPTSVPCGGSPIYTITPDPCYHVADVLVDGSSVGPVLSYTFTDVVANHTIAASFAINDAVGPVTSLAAAQVKFGNDASGTTGITLTFGSPSGASAIEVWRKGYGDYAVYAGGAVPILPVSYPPAGWTLTGVTTSGGVDQPGTRDFWYYIAYAKDACNTISMVSDMTGGTLNYHLGDVSDGISPGQGNNVVNTADASLLGAHYGVSGGALTGYEYLDVGPTTDFTTDGRPTPDGTTDIEDLALFALNYTPAVSAPKLLAASAVPGHDEVSLRAPFVVSEGEVVEVPLTLDAGGGLRALSVAMSWNAAVVAPVGVTPGSYVADQGALMLSPGPGKADVAVLGSERALRGSGDFATVTFRALANGDPQFGFKRAVGRDAGNRALTVATHNPLVDGGPVSRTELLAPVPNPSQGPTVLQYALTTGGPVKLTIYSVDGRRVKSLARGFQEAGRYRVTWSGTDDRGTVLNSGLYFARFEAGGTKATRLISIVK